MEAKHKINNIQEQGLSHLVDYLQRFITFSVSEVEGVNKRLKRTPGRRKRVKYKATGPILKALEKLVDSFKRTVSAYKFKGNEEAKNTLSDRLNKIQSTVEESISSLGIDMSIALARRDLVYFPQSTNDEVYVGQLTRDTHRTSHRNGEGCWANESEFYKGHWSGDKRNGYGIQVFANGSYFKGIWRDDQPMKGRWIFSRRKRFYGWVHPPNDDCPYEYKIGLDKKDERKHRKTANFLYYKDRKTVLSNLEYYQELDIKALKGDKVKDVTIAWLNGVKYKGMFEDFRPSGLGTFILPQDEGNEVKVIIRPSQMLSYKRSEPSTYEEILKKKWVKLTFPNGSFYEGGITEDLNFAGFGYLGSMRLGEYCLFHPSYGKVFEFVDLGEDVVQFFKFSGLDYFKDSEAFLKENTGFGNQSGNPRIKFRFYEFGDVFEYEGGWLDYNFASDKKVKINLPDSKDDKEIVFNAGLGWTVENFTELQDLMIQASGKAAHANDTLKIKFFDGKIAEGRFKIRDDSLIGMGKMTFPDGTNLEGFLAPGIIFDPKDVKDPEMYNPDMNNPENHHIHHIIIEGDIPGEALTNRSNQNQMEQPQQPQEEIIEILPLYRIEYKNGLKYKGLLDEGFNWRPGFEATITPVGGPEQVLMVTETTQKEFGVNLVEPTELDHRVNILTLEYMIDSEGQDFRMRQLDDRLLMTQRSQDCHHMELLKKYKVVKEEGDNALKVACAVEVDKEFEYFDESESSEEEIPDYPNQAKLLDPENFYIYNEDKVHDTMDGIDIKTISKDAIFQKLLYKEPLPIELDIGTKTKADLPPPHEPMANSTSIEGFHSKRPYTQITQSGSFRSTVRLFRLDTNSPQPGQTIPSLASLDPMMAAMFELHQLNGISEVEFDRIKFHNGDEYRFDNWERSYFNSLGVYSKFDNIFNKLFKIDNFYWDKFMARSVLQGMDQGYYDEFFKGRVSLQDFDSFKKVMVCYKDGKMFNPHWIGVTPTNHAEYAQNWPPTEEERLTGSGEKEACWFGQDIVFMNRGTSIRSLLDKAFKEELIMMQKEGEELERREQMIFYRAVMSSLYDKCESLNQLTEIKENNDFHQTYNNKFDTVSTFKHDYRLAVDGKRINKLEDVFLLIDKGMEEREEKAKKQQELLNQREIKKQNQSASEETSGMYQIDGLSQLVQLGAEGLYNKDDKIMNREITIHYANGDYFDGQKHLVLGSMTTGVYRWSQGYSYSGEFFLNTPYGKGVYKTCLGVKRKGYFYRGYFLDKRDYGLEKLRDYIEKEFLGKKKVVMGKEDLRLLTDPNLIRGSALFTQHRVKFIFLLEAIHNCRKMYQRDLENIKDGELDFDYHWGENSANQIGVSLLFKEYNQDENILTAKIGARNSIRNSPGVLGRKSTVHKNPDRKKSFFSFLGAGGDKKTAKPKENTETRLDHDINQENLPKSTTLSKKLKKAVHKTENLLVISDNNRWKEKPNLLKLKPLEIEEIVEMVKDNDTESFEKVYTAFRAKKLTFELLKISDSENRNLLMLAGYFGYRHMFIDLLTALIRCHTKYNVPTNEIKLFLRQKDYEGNNVVDLICIQGFNISDQLIFARKEKKMAMDVDDLSEAQMAASKVNYSEQDQEKIDREKRQQRDLLNIQNDKFFNTVCNRAFALISDKNRPLFQTKFLSFSYLNSSFQEMSDAETSSSDIHFMTKRSVILHSLFELGTHIKDLYFLEKKFYQKKKNNPLHFTLYWADLHSTLALMTQQPMMIFWKNSDDEMPPQAIRLAGERRSQARAIFASILKEFTRIFSFRVIKELLVPEQGFLYYQNIFNGNKHLNSQKDSKSRAQEARYAIDKNDDFDHDNVLLFHNDFILLSDELCKQYLNLLKDKNKYRLLKNEFRAMKKWAFVEMTELQALQRNFLDFYKGSFPGVHPPGSGVDQKEYQENVLKILTWYVYIYGESEIDPDIFTLMEISPFKIVFEGKSMIHFMCENNCPIILKKVLAHLYKYLEDSKPQKPKDGFSSKAEEKKFEVDKAKFKQRRRKFLQDLSEPTIYGQNTPAHLCVIHQNLECLDILVGYGINLELPNARGRTIKDLLENLDPFNIPSDNIITIEKVNENVIDFFKTDLLTTCKIHSLAYEFIPRADHDGIEKIVNNSKFELNQSLTKVRGQVIERFGRYLNELGGKIDDIKHFKGFLKIASEIEEMDSEKRQKEIKKLQKMLLDKSKTTVSYRGEVLEMGQVYHLITLFESQKFSFLPEELLMKCLFSPEHLKTIPKFKYKKFEKYFNKDFLKKLKKHDFSTPLPSRFKTVFKMEQLFCIEIELERGKDLQEHPVVDQVNNIRQKYIKYGGGIKIDMIKGFPIAKKKLFLLDAGEVDQWFILITIADELLKKISGEEQMHSYNMIEEYPTIFTPDSIDRHQLEPLRHHQKVEIMMKLFRDEFDIDNYLTKGIILSFFPIHDYYKRNVIKKLWSENKWAIHFRDIFFGTQQITLRVLAAITYYHGIQQGFYFGFLCLYTNSLFWLAAFGVVMFVLEMGIDMSGGGIDQGMKIFLGSVFVGIWSSLFVNMWKRREKELAFAFDAAEEERIKEIRRGYRAKTVIDPATLVISKQYNNHYLKKLFFTSCLFSLALGCTIGIFVLVTFLNDYITDNVKQESQANFTTAVGVLNGLLNFILTSVYGMMVEWLVEWENHAYQEEIKNSLILKKVSFQLMTSLFTLVAQSLFEKRAYSFFTSQIISNLVTSVLLNYAKSIGVPIIMYLIKRYSLGYVIKCQFCCRGKERGQLEEFKEKIVVDMLANKETKFGFMRYCLEDEEIPEALAKQVADRIKQEQDRIPQSSPVTNNEGQDAELDALNSQRSGKGSNESKDSLEITKDRAGELFEEIERVKPAKKYKGSTDLLGVNRKANISSRLKVEYSKFVLGREKIVETSYMLDLSSLEEGLHMSLLTQYTFIVFFSPFLLFSGLISYLINIGVISLLVIVYVVITRRSISRTVNNIGVWNSLYDIVGYAGIAYNALLIARFNKSLFEIKRKFVEDTEVEEQAELLDMQLMYKVHIALLISKFVLNMIIPKVLDWIEVKTIQESLSKTRVNKLRTEMLSRVGREKSAKEDGSFDERIFEDRETQSLKYYFKNYNKVRSYKEFRVNKSLFKGAENPRMRVAKSRHDLL